MKLPENRISGELKNKIHSLWKIFLTGGIYQESGSSKQTVNSAIRRLEGEDIFDLTHFKEKSKQVFPAENGKRFATETVARIYEAESRAFAPRTEEKGNIHVRLLLTPSPRSSRSYSRIPRPGCGSFQNRMRGENHANRDC